MEGPLGEIPRTFAANGQPIAQISEIGGGAPRGCTCADGEQNSTLNALAVGGVATILDTDDPGAIVIRNQAWQAAEDRCVQLADDLYSPYDSHNCPLVLDKDDSDGAVSPITADGPFGDCSTSELYGTGGSPLPTDSYTDYYTLSREVTVVWGTYHVTQDFYDKMLKNPAWLLEDDARVARAGSGGFTLVGVKSTDIAYALGLRTNDAFLSINGEPLADWPDVIAAHQAVWTDTSFALKIDRGGTTVTLNYVLD
ncbi:MAG: hypothetical protein JKY37_27960 [Nannocystaceae bacterium]|nr:hypothetical protein [Nannocystaceae bacterium]